MREVQRRGRRPRLAGKAMTSWAQRICRGRGPVSSTRTLKTVTLLQQVLRLSSKQLCISKASSQSQHLSPL